MSGAAAVESVRCVGVRIRTLRKRRGLTQEELAARIGRAPETVSALERGRNTPTFGILCGLSAALDVPVRDFFPPGGEADSLRHVALYSELLDAARALPLGDLELATGVVGLMARRRGG